MFPALSPASRFKNAILARNAHKYVSVANRNVIILSDATEPG
jgi:hypothetical protein